MSKAKVTVEFVINYLSSEEEAIKDGFESFDESVRYVIKEEGLFGLVEDDYTIINIEELKGG